METDKKGRQDNLKGKKGPQVEKCTENIIQQGNTLQNSRDVFSECEPSFNFNSNCNTGDQSEIKSNNNLTKVAHSRSLIEKKKHYTKKAIPQLSAQMIQIAVLGVIAQTAF